MASSASSAPCLHHSSLQLRRDCWRGEPQIREEGGDCHQPCTSHEVRAGHQVVEKWSQEAWCLVVPDHRVDLLIGVPHSQSHAQPRTSTSANARAVINKLQRKKQTRFIAINADESAAADSDLEQPQEDVAVS